MSLKDCKTLLIKNNICEASDEIKFASTVSEWQTESALSRVISFASVSSYLRTFDFSVTRHFCVDFSTTLTLKLSAIFARNSSLSGLRLYLSFESRTSPNFRRRTGPNRWYQSNEALFQYWLIKYIKLFPILFLTKTNENETKYMRNTSKWNRKKSKRYGCVGLINSLRLTNPRKNRKLNKKYKIRREKN